MAVDFQDEDKSGTEKVARNPNNYNILKGGKVDPRSKLYQRSVAGREQLKDYLNRLWNDGGDEADVFMAGVKSLMNRGHGYVGAYLDSKNPGRRYTDNQAKAIVDQVMTDEGIGEHPGARLTRPKAEDDSPEAKEKAKQAKATRKEANVARGSGPQQAPGQKAMPVGQQRKQGKRESTGQALEDSQRPGREGGAEGSRAVKEDASKYRQPVRTGTGETEFYNVDKVRKTLEDWKKGEATMEDVLEEFQNTYQKPLTDSPQAVAERRQKRAESRDRYYTTGSGRMPDEEEQKRPGAQGSARPSGAQPPSGGGQPPAATPQPEQEQPEEKAKWRAPGEGREDTGIVEEVRTGVSGTGGGMLSAQSRPVIGPWARNENEYKQSITSVFDRLIKDEVESQYEGLGGVRDPRKKIGIESKIYSDPKELEYVIKDTIRDFVSKDKNLQGTDFDDFARNHLNKLIAYRTGQEVEEEPSVPEEQAPPEEQTPNRATRRAQGQRGSGPRREKTRGTERRGFGSETKPSPEQIKAIKEKVAKVPKEQLIKEMKQGTLFPSGLVTETSQTNPLEGGSTSAPGIEQPVDEKTPEETGDSLLDEEGAAKDFRKSGPRRKKTRGTERRGFGSETKPSPEQIKAIKEKVAKVPKEKLIKEMKQGNLFGQTAIETGSAATNPLEDSPPDQYERFRGDPAEKFKGAQEGGRELPTAGRGQEGQGSLLKKGTMEARGDFKKGAKPKPSRPSQPGPKSYEQTDLFGKDDFKSDQGGGPAPTESAPPDETKPSESPGQKTFLSKAKGKETQILPSAIQVPKPGQGVTDAESYTRQLQAAKIPTKLINDTVKKTYGTKPRGKARSKGPKVTNSAEYQEFAQSIRSIMR